MAVEARTDLLPLCSECTLVWAVAIAIIMWFFSNLRDFKVSLSALSAALLAFGGRTELTLVLFNVLQHMAYIGIIASTTMFICTIITIAGHGTQGESC